MNIIACEYYEYTDKWSEVLDCGQVQIQDCQWNPVAAGTFFLATVMEALVCGVVVHGPP